MSQTEIPFLFMRGGTSRGPYFNRADLPEDRETLSEVLMATVGAGHPLNIDGIGGGASVTTKTAMLSRSEEPDIDVDYFFAQVEVTERLVDYKPTCGNILSGVGPAALEMGLVPAQDGETLVRIRAVNTGARVHARVHTPGGRVAYEGAVAIDGVPGTHAPVHLAFMDVAGSVTGAMLPTGRPLDEVDGVAVSCVDVAMPVVVARAADLGKTGYESKAALEEDSAFMARIEALRRAAGAAMGMGDVAASVTPKFAMVAPAQAGGAFAARYFTPWSCHPTMAVTGAQCLAATALIPGSVAEGLMPLPTSPSTLVIEHASGSIDVALDFERTSDALTVRSAGLVRTARLLAKGVVMAPRAVWAG